MKKVPPPRIKTSLDHLPLLKRRELTGVMAIMHEEFADALAERAADFKKGFIGDPVNKSKSLILTDEGLERSKALFLELFTRQPR